MVAQQLHTLDTTFAALSDPTRRSMLARLSRAQTISVSHLAEPFQMSLPAVMKHVRVLENAGLIEREKRGRTVFCTLKPAPMRAAADWLKETEAFWNARLDALAEHLEKTAPARSRNKEKSR